LTVRKERDKPAAVVNIQCHTPVLYKFTNEYTSYLNYKIN